MPPANVCSAGTCTYTYVSDFKLKHNAETSNAMATEQWCGHSVADHLNRVNDKLTIFPSAVEEVTGVNNSLKELIDNSTALEPEGFGAPDHRDPRIEFKIENFNQAVRELITKSNGFKNTIKGLAKYASNAGQIQRIKDDMRSGDGVNHSINSYLKVIGGRMSNCRKHVEKIQPEYEKLHDEIVFKQNQQRSRLASSRNAPAPLWSYIARLICPTPKTALFTFTGIIGLALGYFVYTLTRNSTPGYVYSSFTFYSAPAPQTLMKGFEKRIKSSYRGAGDGRFELRTFMAVAIGCASGIAFYVIQKFFRTPEAQRMKVNIGPQQQFSPPDFTTGTSTLQSARDSVSTFLAKLEKIRCQLLDLEQCMVKAADCKDYGSIDDLEIQLHKLQQQMETILTLTK